MFIKHRSSPIAKLEYINNTLKEVLPDDCINAADASQNFVVYSMLKLGKQSSNFLIEKVYIDSFVHEDINKLEQF